MIRLLPLVLLLAGCGIDGRPVPPSEVGSEPRNPEPSVTISGSATAGIVRTF
ncbi:argininosuccinate lyase [uncultured Jannaschia sp.]|uniref:argininosuccinate lyase n=1 Tax=uncultured Jannaschia sp. TaxID=293347 RepID=UPI0026141A65|nr:argininosuccinate lyase [uncultured Jannaschia sp.]